MQSDSPDKKEATKVDFLEKILPRKGFYCAAQLAPKGGFRHTFFSDLPSLQAFLHTMDAGGHTMYLAQGGFKTSENRKGENTAFFRSFWFDIDSGAEKFAKDPANSYPSQIDSLKALKVFCHDTGLPWPAIVNSGNGLYSHWLISEDVPAEKWKALAQILKKLAAAHGYKADPMRTADAASVLRPVGTTNRKDADNQKPVKLLQDMEPISLERFVSILEAASKEKKIAAPALAVPTQFKGINDEFTAGIDGPPASAVKIADKCAQVRFMRDMKGDIPEPLWYACIGLLRHCTEGDELIHEWSQGHPDYSAQATQAKIDHHVESGTGPTTCAKFGSDNPTGCVACLQANRIKSPIVLGRPEMQAAEAVTEEETQILPYGFKRTEHGLFWEEEGSAPLRFYTQDLYPCKIAFDSSLGYETVTIRHQMPVTREYKEFSLRSSLLHDPKTLLMNLADNHVQVSGKECRNAMCAFLDRYMDKLRQTKSLATLHSQMGWQKEGDGQVFVLGETIYKMGSEEETAGFAKNIPEVAKAFHAKGDLNEWVAATRDLGLPGMEPLAFAFLAGAFGAPLMQFTGFAGAMVALVGRSGIGKTLVGEWALSTYGDPQKLILLKNDTVNALVSRLGLYGSLPLYLDEISNIEGQELSDLLYRVTQGRDKARLGRDSRERAVLNSWNTIAVASSNHSLIDKLSSLKSDASAEINRIMEIPCRPVASFGREQATPCYHTFTQNYGVAGPLYIKAVVEAQDTHHEKLDGLVQYIDRLSEARSEERFWSAMAAVAIYGGMIAKKAGLIKFEVTPILSWVVEAIKDLRVSKMENVASSADVLGQFLDSQAASILITANDSQKPGHVCSILREPRGPIIGRIQIDQNLLFVSRSELKRYLDRSYGSYTELKDELLRIGALKKTDMRKVLGSGTYIGGTQQPCWMVDLSCMELGRTTLSVVRDITKKESAAGAA